jgi:hypothetical protein
VRIDESRCPFCGAAAQAGRLELVVVGRTSRARLVAIATSIASAAIVSGCPSTQQPVYGGPPSPPVVGPTPEPDTREDAGAVSDGSATTEPPAPTEHPPVALYGAPPSPQK